MLTSRSAVVACPLPGATDAIDAGFAPEWIERSLGNLQAESQRYQGRYAYVRGNPVSNGDLAGLDPLGGINRGITSGEAECLSAVQNANIAMSSSSAVSPATAFIASLTLGGSIGAGARSAVILNGLQAEGKVIAAEAAEGVIGGARPPCWE